MWSLVLVLWYDLEEEPTLEEEQDHNRCAKVYDRHRVSMALAKYGCALRMSVSTGGSLVKARHMVAQEPRRGGSVANTRPYMSALLIATLFGGLTTGCAHTATQSKQSEQERALQARLDEVERTNGRLSVRIEELEDQLFLLNDRVEAHRLALQRRGFMRDRALALAPQAPGPAPETYYVDGQDTAANNVQTPRAQRQVTRIPLGTKNVTAPTKPERQESEPATARAAEPSSDVQDVVYSEKQYRDFAGEPARSQDDAPSRSSASNTSSYGRQAQPPVTDERLGAASAKSSPAPARELLEKRFAPEPEKTPSSAPSAAPKGGLAAYRDALAQYRAGNYQEALTGFEGFLAAGPKEDYVDNALYWIGECHYGLGHYADAITQFERVLNEQADGNKVPDAMLKMSLAMERVGQRERALKVLNDLVSRYPMTNAAGLGKKRLAELGQTP